MQPTKVDVHALIADDEALLVADLTAALADLWPELVMCKPVADGLSAIDAIATHRPDIVFLDIQMPGATGLDVAQEIAEEWLTEQVPLIVFVTAHDEFAVQAFDTAAVDYLTKPVSHERLQRCIGRLKQRLARPVNNALQDLADQVGTLLAQGAPANAAPLSIVRAAVGDQVRLIPLDDVIMFEAADKYVNVATASGDALIRQSLRELLPQLDSTQFAQIHRSRIVNLKYVLSAERADNGKLHLVLDGRPERPIVSRIFAGLFRAM